MPKKIAPLEPLTVKKAKPKTTPYKLFDGGGLFLLIVPTGGKLWRLKYRIGGKEKFLALGTYPEISLADAREKREVARKQVAAGIDPGAVRKAEKAASKTKSESDGRTFEVVSNAWIAQHELKWDSRYLSMVSRRLEREVYPTFGNRPVTGIQRTEVVALIEAIQARPALESAKRTKHYFCQIFQFALNRGWITDAAILNLDGIVKKRVAKNYASITDPKEIGPLLKAIDGYQGGLVVKSALRLAPLVFVRSSELRQAEWVEFDLEAAEWNIPAERMKSERPHLVPLSRQAVAILKELNQLTGDFRYVFTNHHNESKPIASTTLLEGLRRTGYGKESMTFHGFRAMARTVLDEVLQVRPDFIEHQLAHVVKDANGRAYNRTSHIDARRKMMQVWADYLDGLKAGAKVLPFKRSDNAEVGRRVER